MSVVIKVENISKQYRLGTVGTGSLAHDLNRGWHRLRGKEDPYLKIGEANDRAVKGSSEYVWALQNINFDVKQGEVLGIIGRNGAGKSTLLKILSRTTTPTTGSIKIKGRVASLLEVGTGFHPELSGRENIFLNGAILGMTKKEIKSKFDEIVDFAGVERYIDTPVKRYSSGMYVRLAFGVAAHLEPEILIVDEVLAVGDAEFQKKALGKMKDVSTKDGRTVLFVSHNMAAIKNLCETVMYLKNGLVEKKGFTNEVINYYLSNDNSSMSMRQYFKDFEHAPGNEKIRLHRAEVCPIIENNDPITVRTAINIEFDFWCLLTNVKINLSMKVSTLLDEIAFVAVSEVKTDINGLLSSTCYIPANLLNDGTYQISMLVVTEGMPNHNFENIISIEVNEKRDQSAWHGKWPGMLRPKLDFTLTKK